MQFVREDLFRKRKGVPSRVTVIRTKMGGGIVCIDGKFDMRYMMMGVWIGFGWDGYGI